MTKCSIHGYTLEDSVPKKQPQGNNFKIIASAIEYPLATDKL